MDRRKAGLLATIILITAGFALVFYPAVSEWNNNRLQEQIMAQYDSEVGKAAETEIDEAREKAKDYNEHLQSGSVVLSDPFDDTKFLPSQKTYDGLLNIDGSGVMGYLEIPQLSVELAIYHTTEDSVMRKGAGHLPGTSLPVGGPGSHSVLSSHRGLPSAKLFTDLDKLQIGDEFYIHVLDETLAYKVDQVKTVEPEDVSDLEVYEGEDHVTLVTCTPYSVNTHRLLVRGVRTEYAEDEKERLPLPKRALPYSWQSFLVGVPAACGVVVVLLITRKKKSHKE